MITKNKEVQNLHVTLGTSWNCVPDGFSAILYGKFSEINYHNDLSTSLKLIAFAAPGN